MTQARACLLATAALLGASGTVGGALAQELPTGKVGQVKGVVYPADPNARTEPPIRSQGFLPRMANPLLPTARHDPLPHVVVVLEPNGNIPAEARQPPRTPGVYHLVGEAFATPIFPVVAKGELEIKNLGRDSRRLHCPELPDLLPADPINPGGVRTAKLAVAYHAVDIRDHDSPHVRGRLIAFPLRFFSLVDATGSFTIDEVPAGSWNVRIWYDNGWLAMPPTTIFVTPKKTTLVPDKLRLPANPQVEVPKLDGAPE
jgi:hypothetical protein